MKILHVCDSIIGGTGSYLAELLPHQGKRYGAGAVALLIPFSHLPYLESLIPDSGVEILTFPRKNRLMGLFCLFFVYLYHRMRLKPDIVHAHSFGAGLVTRLTKPFSRPRVVYCPHGWAFDMASFRWRNLIVERLEYILSLVTDRLILISGYEHRRGLKIGINDKIMQTVQSGVAPNAPAGQPAVWQDNRLKLLFVGRFDQQKGLDILLEAIAPLGDKVVLRTIGSSIVSSDFGPRPPLPFVEYLGWLPRDEVASHMRASDVLVVPSRWEGFGLVALEAMRLSLPVIVSRVGGLREIVDDGRYGCCFTPGDAIALRRCIEDITPDSLAEWQKIVHQRFVDSYTSERMTASIDEIYLQLAR